MGNMGWHQDKPFGGWGHCSLQHLCPWHLMRQVRSVLIQHHIQYLHNLMFTAGPPLAGGISPQCAVPGLADGLTAS